MTAFLIVLHVLVCVFLILFVLLQPGARGGVGAAFGGAGGQTVFGGRGANTFLAKLTAAAAVIFMLTSISLSFFVTKSSSVMSGRASDAPVEEPKEGDKPADGAADTGAAKVDPAAPPAAVSPTPPAEGAAVTPPPAEAPPKPAEKPAGDPPPAP